MNQTHLRRLVGVELRRSRSHVLTALVLTAASVPALKWTGRDDASTLGTILLFAAMASCMGVLGNVFKDKLTGQLEFLTTLPVRSSTLAAATFMANVLAFLPVAAAVAAVTHWVVLPGVGIDIGGQWLLGAFLAGWLFASAFAGLSCGMMIRFDARKLVFAPVVLVFAGLLVGAPIEQWIRANVLTALEFAFANPGMAWVIGTAAYLLVLGTIIGVGFFVACQGYERYRPQPELMEW